MIWMIERIREPNARVPVWYLQQDTSDLSKVQQRVNWKKTYGRKKKKSQYSLKGGNTEEDDHLRDLPRAEKTGKAGMSSGLTKAQ